MSVQTILDSSPEKTNDSEYQLDKDDLISLKSENTLLSEEINEVSEKLKEKEAALVIEAEVSNNKDEENKKIVNRLKKQVSQYRDEVVELKAKLETISLAGGTNPSQLPSAICQLETKVRELYKQKEEEQSIRDEELRRLLEECEEKTERTVNLAALNKLLKTQLTETQDIVGNLNTELSLCRQQMEQELLEKDLMNKSSDENSIASSAVSLTLEEASILQKEFHSTKHGMINELEILNQDMVAMTNELLKHIEQEANKIKSSHDSDLKKKEEECKNLTEEVASLQTIISDGNTTVSSLRDELANVQTLKVISEKLLDDKTRELQGSDALCEHLKFENGALSSQLKTQNTAFATCEKETTKLKEAIALIVRMLTTSDVDLINKEELDTIDTDRNGIQVASWAISEVKAWMESQNNLNKQQEYKQTVLKRTCDELATQISNNQEEMKPYEITEHKMIEQMESLKEMVESLHEAKLIMKMQINDIDNKKRETEAKLTLSEGIIKQHVQEMDKLRDLKDRLEKKLRNIETETDAFRERETERESELQNRIHFLKCLEQQLHISQDEVLALQRTISRLNSEKVETNSYVADLKLQITLYEAEKQAARQEVSSIQESNNSLLVRIVELQRDNSLLEVEKRSIEQSLSAVSNTRVILGHENAELNKQKIADKDEIHYIQHTNKDLNSKIEELDKNLSELEFTCMKLRNEKDKLSQEASCLDDAVSKLRRALSEVQIQRGKLCQSIAKAAQDKGELVQIKMQLTSELTRLQANFHATKDELTNCKSEKEKLVSLKVRLEEKLVEGQKQVLSLEHVNICLQEEKQKLITDHVSSIQLKEDMIQQIQSSHSQQMEKMVSDSTAKDSELQQNLSNQNNEYSNQISDIKSLHKQELLAMEQEYNQTIKQMKSEMITLRQKYIDEIASLKHDNEITIRDLEKQHETLANNYAEQKLAMKKQQLRLEVSKQESENIVNKLKHQLQLSENTVDELGKELNSTEKQLFGLQSTLDQVKTDAHSHLDDLQNDLLEVTTTATQLERDLHEAQVSVKHLEASRNHYRQLLESAQTSIDELYRQEDGFVTEKRNSQRELKEMNLQLQKQKEFIVSSEKMREKVQAERDLAIVDIGHIRKSLLLAEKSFTELSSEHNSLHKSLALVQKETSDLKLQLCSSEAENQKMAKTIEEEDNKIDKLNNKLTIITLTHYSKEEEIVSIRNILNITKDEKERLQLSLAHLEDISVIENQNSSSTIASLKMSSQEIERQNNELIATIRKQETMIERKKQNSDNLKAEFSVLKESTDRQLKQAVDMYRDACEAYNQLKMLLTECFNERFEEENHLIPKNKRVRKSSDLESSFSTPDLLSTSINELSSSLPEGIAPIKLVNITKVNQAIMRLQSTSLAQQKSNVKLEEDLSILQQQIQQLKSQQNESNDEITDLTRSLDSMKSSYEVMVKANMELKEMVADKNDEIKMLNNQIESLYKQSETLEEELQVCNLDVQTNEVRVSALMEDLLEKEMEKTKAIGIVKQTQLTLNEYKNDNGDLKNRLRNLQSQIERKEAENEELSRRIQFLEVSAENKVATSRSEAERLKNSLKSSIEVNCSLELRVRTQANKYEMMEKANKNLVGQLDKMGKTLKLSCDREKAIVKQIEEITETKLEENEMLQRSLQEAKDRNMEIEEELKIALQHGQVAQDTIAKHSQQSRQFAVVTKKNFELMSQIRDIEKKIIQRGETHAQELKACSQKFELFKAETEFTRKRWEAEEEMLRNSLEEQERKISWLEGKWSHTKKSKARFVEKVQQQDSAITRFHSVLSDSLNSFSGKNKHQRKMETSRYGSTGDDDQRYND